MLPSLFSWTANFNVQLLAENDLGIKTLESGKYGTIFKKVQGKMLVPGKTYI